jgi:hypothetical protein
MKAIATSRDAKEFLISRIAQEALEEGVPLSEIETKIMYFSETAWTLPDIDEVSEAFDRDYDQPDYERKIRALVRHLRDRLRKTDPDDLKTWDDAVRALRKEDHYLLVLIDAGHDQDAYSIKSPQVWLLALAITAATLLAIYLFR